MIKTWGLILLIALWAVSISAQDSEPAWTATLFDGLYTLTTIDSNGQILDQFPVGPVEPTRDNMSSYAGYKVLDVKLSPSGRYLASSIVSEPIELGSGEPIKAFFVVYDLTARPDWLPIIEYQLSTDSEAVLDGQQIFDENEQHVVMGIEHYQIETGDDGSVFRTYDKRFEIHLFDLAVGNTPVATLPDQPFLNGFGIGLDFNDFRDGKVAFSITDNQGDFPMMTSQTWDIASNELLDDPRFTALSQFYGPTGESIEVWGSEEYASAEDVGKEFIFFQFNVVWVYHKNEWRPFYHDAHHTLFAQFVQNGERVLVSAEGNDEIQSLVLLERDGSTVETTMPKKALGLRGVKTTPDGFLYVGKKTGDTPIIEVNTREGLTSERIVATIPDNIYENAAYRIIWVKPSDSVVSDYMEWQFLPPAQP